MTLRPIVSTLTQTKCAFWRYIVLLIWSCGSQFAWAQHFSSYKNLQITNYTEIDGTPIEFVGDITQDEFGFIWLASDRGLLRFDGHRLERYNLKNHPELETETIRFVEAGKNGNIWFATRRGVFKLNDGKVTPILSAKGEKMKPIFHWFLDDTETLWVVKDEQVYHTDSDTFKVWTPQNTLLYKVYKGKNNLHWAVRSAGNEKQIFRVDTGHIEPFVLKSQFTDRFEFLFEASDGRLFIGAVSGKLHQVKEGVVSEVDAEAKPYRVYDIIEDSQGTIWYPGVGLNYITRNGDKGCYQQKDGLTNNKVLSVFQDRDGAIWAGTKYGLSRLTPGAFQTVFKMDTVVFNPHMKLDQFKDQIWMGTTENGLWKLMQGTPQRVFQQELPAHIVNLDITPENELIITGEKAIYSVKDNEVNILKKTSAYLAFKDISGALHSISANDTIVVDYPDGRQSKQKLPINYANHFSEDHNGNVWLTNTDGLYVYKGESYSYFSNADFFTKYLFRVNELSQNELWVNSYGTGIARMKGADVDFFSTRNGLPFNNAEILFSTPSKQLWQYVKDEGYGKMVRLFVNGDSDSNWISQGEAYGLVYLRENNIPKVWPTQDGDVYVRGEEAIYKFNPEVETYPIPQLYLDQFTVNGEKRDVSQTISLNPGDRNIALKFSCLDFNYGHLNQFQYQLVGFDSNWISINDRNTIYFTALPPGNYTFRLRVIWPNGETFELNNPLTIEKHRAWYANVWALIGYSLLLALLVRFIYRLRIKNLQKQRAELQAKVKLRTKELRKLNESLEEKVEQRTAELSNSEERLRYALEASNDGIFDLDVRKGKIKFSPAIYTMLGFEPYEFPETRKALFKHIVSEDMRIIHEEFYQDLYITVSDEVFVHEYRMQSKQGEIVWVRVKAKVMERDEIHQPTRIVGTHTDITSEKRKTKEILETVLKTEDVERSRIAKEIHDGLQQTLTVASLNFQSVKKSNDLWTEQLKEKFETGWKYLQNSISESRTVAHNLMPKAIEDFGIVAAFESLISEMNEALEGTDLNFQSNISTGRLDNPQIEVTLYRILQEALNNIVKYAKSDKVDIQLNEFDNLVVLIIEDNGVGFDLKILDQNNQGLGFKSMKNRLDAINGVLDVSSFPGKGTTILVEINKGI